MCYFREHVTSLSLSLSPINLDKVGECCKEQWVCVHHRIALYKSYLLLLLLHRPAFKLESLSPFFVKICMNTLKGHRTMSLCSKCLWQWALVTLIWVQLRNQSILITERERDRQTDRQTETESEKEERRKSKIDSKKGENSIEKGKRTTWSLRWFYFDVLCDINSTAIHHLNGEKNTQIDLLIRKSIFHYSQNTCNETRNQTFQTVIE